MQTHGAEFGFIVATCASDKIIKLVFINSQFNVADGLTKLLIEKSFGEFTSWILEGYGEDELTNYLNQSKPEVKPKKAKRKTKPEEIVN